MRAWITARRPTSAVAALVLAGALTVLLPATAFADGPITGGDSGGSSKPPPAGQPPAGSSGGQINVRVQAQTHYEGHGTATTPLQSSDANWSPPGCWFEPRFTPDQYETYFRNVMTGWSTGKQYVQDQWNELEKSHYHKGDKGLWWQITYNPDVPAQYSLDHCPPYDWPEVWVPTGDPAPPPGVPTPTDLKDIAYAATELPQPDVQLSPAADNQVVNLATYAKFAGALGRVYTTAQISAPAYGINVAATVVAVPTALRLDASTSDAAPQSCVYDLVGSPSRGYQVDTSHAACNITYRRAGTYTLNAAITWHVTWSPSADPDAPPSTPSLPDGQSGNDTTVTTHEIQTINR